MKNDLLYLQDVMDQTDGCYEIRVNYDERDLKHLQPMLERMEFFDESTPHETRFERVKNSKTLIVIF